MLFRSRTIETYNQQVSKWTEWLAKRGNRTRFDKLTESEQQLKIDNFVLYNNQQLNWSEGLKSFLKRQILAEFDADKIRNTLYRPFTRSYLYFDRVFNERVYVFPSIFPTPKTETENQVIGVTGLGSEKPFMVFLSQHLVDLHLVGAGSSSQCFPFYSYHEDGANRTENLTDWALSHYRQHYQDNRITKWAIFYYVYGLLHHPGYRDKYAANLKRELPRLPMADDFWAFSNAGKKLAKWHLNYEQQPPYPLKMIENPKVPYSLRVEKMRLSKDQTQLIYNHFLTLDGIPSQVFNYQLGNRSALEWVIDQYRLKADKRSGLINDPNQEEDEGYIVELVKKVITVSLNTVKVIDKLSEYNYQD